MILLVRLRAEGPSNFGGPFDFVRRGPDAGYEFLGKLSHRQLDFITEGCASAHPGHGKPCPSGRQDLASCLWKLLS